LIKYFQHSDAIVLKHIHLPGNLIPWFLATLLGIKVVFIAQRLPDKINPLLSLWLSFVGLLAGITKTRTIATANSGYLALKKKVPNVKYIPACIDPREIKTRQKAFNEQALQILCIAKIIPRKNIPLLIRALGKLTKAYPKIQFQLTIIGRHTSPAELDAIQVEIHKNRLTKEVAVLAEMPPQEITKHFCAADIFVLPAEKEPLGFSILEAMAYGIPVITTSDVGASCYVLEDVNGYICTPGSAESLFEAISKFLEIDQVNTAKIKRFGISSRRIAVNNHSPQILDSCYLEVITN
jgi:glycosyltransferase involved in cell wall biosynthesis